jgi:hypothetical protein
VRHLKDPNAVFEFVLHARRWLGARTLTGVVWELVKIKGSGATNLSLQSQNQTGDGGRDATAEFIGGTAGDNWSVTAHLTASDADTLDHTTEIRIRQTG